jgi:hypothetical protein
MESMVINRFLCVTVWILRPLGVAVIFMGIAASFIGWDTKLVRNAILSVVKMAMAEERSGS